MENGQQQSIEGTQENLYGTEAKKKIKEMAENAKSCFFCTRIETGKPLDVRPMSVQKVDDEGNFWFLSSKESHKNQELQSDDAVQLLFQSDGYSDYLSIYGKATVSQDKEKIKELWEPLAKVWFTEGVDDPRITVIKVAPEEGYYWDTKHGKIVAFAKMIAGVFTGKTLDDSVEGTIQV